MTKPAEPTICSACGAMTPKPHIFYLATNDQPIRLCRLCVKFTEYIAQNLAASRKLVGL